MNEKLISLDETDETRRMGRPPATEVTGVDDAVPGSPTWLPAWDGARYAANTGHHRVYDQLFLDTLPVRSGDVVLDLGCGSGDFTTIVAALVPDGQVVGLDPQPSLLAEARLRAAPNQRFVEGAVQQLGGLFPVTESFEVVMTRAVLQWVPLADHPAVLADAFRLLRPGGWYRAEFGGAGNIPVILRLLDDVAAGLGGPQCPWTFADVGPYLELVEQGGFDLDDGFLCLTPQRRHFNRETLLGWFHSQAVQAYTTTMDPEAGAAFVRGVESRFDELARWDGTFDQTFVRMDLLARRPA
jgi:ubiquinone/menaquinone biosynthesis C-methylase UbiE